MDLESSLNLEADEPQVVDFVREHGGDIERDGQQAGVYWLTLHPRSSPNESYYVRLAWQSYPHAAPSVKFADGVRGGLHSTRAWPVIAGYRPGSYDICKPFTAEAFALHPEWRTGPDAWRSEGNPFLWVVGMLQHDVDNHYQGRSP